MKYGVFLPTHHHAPLCHINFNNFIPFFNIFFLLAFNIMKVRCGERALDW